MQHFTTFTADRMAAFRQEIRGGDQRRREMLEKNRDGTRELLDGARRDRGAAEDERRGRAARDAAARLAFMNDLREQVTAMKDDTLAMRAGNVSDLRAMAEELRAAQEAYHGGSPDGESRL